MTARNYKKLNDNIIFLSSHGLDCGLHIKPPSARAMTRFELLGDEQKNAVSSTLDSWLSTFKEIPFKTKPDGYEVFAISRAAEKLNLEIPDSFKSKIISGDIVEIYELETGHQIYRNLKFLDVSSYDALTMMTHSFEELFERSDKFHQQLIERAKEIALRSETTQSWNIEDHYLKEKLDLNKKVFRMKMKYISPVFKFNERYAWASTLRAEPVHPICENHKNIYSLY